jgi:hypothetical protein
MTCDKNSCIYLEKERDGLVSFGNDDLAKIREKGTVKIRSMNAKAKNVLLVEYMKNNLHSVSQMCDQGHRLIFDSEKCEIRKEGSRKLVATVVRTLRNIYILNENGKERCCLGRENEIFLWHEIMGHINFDNLVNISRKEVVRDMPKILKPTSTMCKHFLQGKKTRTEFRSKEYSMIKSLEIMHIDLCGPT